MKDSSLVGAAAIYTKDSKTAERVILALALILAVLLRNWGINPDLPYLYDIDEPVFVDPALRMVWSGDLNPHWFGHPGSTVIYINALIYLIIRFVGQVLGWFSDLSGFKSFYLADPTLFYLLPRSFFALFGTFSAFLVYLIARALYGAAPALVASFALAVSPLHIEFSEKIRSDVLASGLILLVAYFALRIFRTRSLHAYVWAGALTGVAVATKYPSVMALGMILFAHLFGDTNRLKNLWKLLVAGICAVVTLFLSSPYLFVDYVTALDDIRAATYTHLGANGGGVIDNMWWYVNTALVGSVGWPALCLCILAAFVAVRNRQSEVIMLVAFIFMYLLLIASVHIRWERWAVPLLPFFAILTAGGLNAVWVFSRARWPILSGKALVYVAGVLTLLPIAFRSVQDAAYRTLPDSRTAARNWIVANIPKDSRILVESHGPQLPRGQYQFFDVDWNGNFTASNLPIHPSSNAETANIVPISNVGTVDVKALSQLKIDYVVLSVIYDLYQQEPTRYPRNVENYQKFLRIADPVVEFMPRNDQLQGPNIRIFRLAAARQPSAGSN